MEKKTNLKHKFLTQRQSCHGVVNFQNLPIFKQRHYFLLNFGQSNFRLYKKMLVHMELTIDEAVGRGYSMEETYEAIKTRRIPKSHR